MKIGKLIKMVNEFLVVASSSEAEIILNKSVITPININASSKNASPRSLTVAS